MIILIPLGGIGLRFSQNGYKQPKALINVMGKPILYWLLDNLKIPPNTTVCVPYNKVYAQYRLESMLIKEYPHIQFKFLCLHTDTGGAADTIYQCLNELIKGEEEDQPVLCLDSDNFYTCDVIGMWGGKNNVFSFFDTQPHPIYSYIQVESGSCRILDIVEKEKVSNHASCGAYGFESWKKLQAKCKYVLDQDIRQKGEFYTSTVIREMITDGERFDHVSVETKQYICLGTPTQVRLFCHNYPLYSSLNNHCLIQPKRYCFDLDNTLVTFPKIPNDYTTVEPIQKNIELLRYLKRFGHTIIIYTARRMKTHKGNVGKIMQDIGKTTFDTLLKFDIPYDEIYFGKPEANVYIDDLALNCFDDLEKELGYYKTMIQPREFNTIRSGTIEVCTKTSANLEGEIYYYTHIPLPIKDMFPILLDYDPNNTWYSIEKINGITASSLYLSQLLTEDQLKHIMKSIYRLQQVTPVVDPELHILDNYMPKMRERYDNYDYSRFPDHKQVFDSIEQDLDSYWGNLSVIHGDPVFTNILINDYGKIKFIDMRGKMGTSKLTIHGDFLYDWAKMYQSLIGYDEIHEDVHLNTEYKKRMIQCFEDYFEELFDEHVHFSYVKAITKCLLFSMIPLHNNEKCDQYYALIHSSYLIV
jgi:capsule biosynthesis phosphatase